MPQTINNMVQEWTNALTTYTAIKMNIPTDVSAAGSLLMDLQVGGSSKFRVSKNGTIGLSGNAPNPSFSITDPGGTARMLQYNLAGSNGSIYWDDLTLSRRGTANLRLGNADTGAVTASVSITIASPGVVTWNSHGLSTGTPVVFTTDGALPTGITAGTTYYAVVVGANTFQLATSVANAIAATPTVITTSGTQSGTHTGTRYNITQRLGMQGITGVADRLGADLIIQGSQGTGTGAGGSIVFQVAPAGSSGTAQNALITAVTIDGAGRIQSNIFGYEVNNSTNTLFSVQGTALIQRAGSTVQLTTANYWQQLEFFTAATKRMTINSTGLVSVGDGSISAPPFRVGTATGLNSVQFYSRASGWLTATNGTTNIFELQNVSGGSGVINLNSTGRLQWCSGGAGNTAGDVLLTRDDANKLALRNDANAQTFRVYNTTDGTNSEFGKIAWESNAFVIGTEKTGTGTNRRLWFSSATNDYYFANPAGGGVTFTFANNPTLHNVLFLNSSGPAIGSTMGYRWSGFSGPGATPDLALVRAAATIVKVTDASTGGGAVELQEMTAPAAPGTNNVRIYAEDNGSGKTRLMALFPTGAAVQIAIEP